MLLRIYYLPPKTHLPPSTYDLLPTTYDGHLAVVLLRIATAEDLAAHRLALG